MTESSTGMEIARGIKHVTPSPLFQKLTNIYNVISNQARFKRRIRNVPTVGELDTDVLFVVVDCLRADHTTMEGYERDTTPFLNGFAGEYANAVSAAPWTFPSVPSLLTGKYPHEHGATFAEEFRNFDTGNLPSGIDDEIYTLSELFAKEGYSTYFSSAIVTASLAINGRFEKININHNARAESLVDDFINWWEKNENRFGYLHFGDLHQPLHIPDSQPFGKVDRNLDEITGWDYQQEAEYDDGMDYYMKERVKLYDTILSEIDGEIQRLVEFLRSRGDLEDTTIVVVGDHGEEFWEHTDQERESYQDPRGFYGVGHGHSTFEEVLRVPLIIRGPSEDFKSQSTISTTDIAPLILRNAVSESSFELSNHSLIGSNFAPDTDAVLSEGIGYGYEKKAVYKGQYKFVHSASEDEPDFLFDLTNDSNEMHGVENPEKRQEFEQLLSNVETSRVGEVSLGAGTRDQLEDLGYI